MRCKKKRAGDSKKGEMQKEESWRFKDVRKEIEEEMGRETDGYYKYRQYVWREKERERE